MCKKHPKSTRDTLSAEFDGRDLPFCPQCIVEAHNASCREGESMNEEGAMRP